MPTLEKFVQSIITHGPFTFEQFGLPATFEGAGRSPEDVVTVRGRSNWLFVSMSAATYTRFYGVVREIEKNFPVELYDKFPEPGVLKPTSPKQIMLRDPAATLGGRVVLSWHWTAYLHNWLDGVIGKKGIASRNKIERIFFPERFPLPEPKVAERRPERVVEDSPALTKKELVQLGLGTLEKGFDLEAIRPAKLPKLDVFQAFVANGKDSAELFASGAEEPPTIWILQDGKDYHAALVGSALGLDYQRKVARSSIGFYLPTCTYSELRQTLDLAALLNRSGSAWGDGWHIVTSHRDQAVGTLISLRRLLEVFGLANK